MSFLFAFDFTAKQGRTDALPIGLIGFRTEREVIWPGTDGSQDD
jgi:hypothetical protein